MAGAPSTTAEPNTTLNPQNVPTNIGRYEDAGLKDPYHENAISRGMGVCLVTKTDTV